MKAEQDGIEIRRVQYAAGHQQPPKKLWRGIVARTVCKVKIAKSKIHISTCHVLQNSFSTKSECRILNCKVNNYSFQFSRLSFITMKMPTLNRFLTILTSAFCIDNFTNCAFLTLDICKLDFCILERLPYKDWVRLFTQIYSN